MSSCFSLYILQPIQYIIAGQYYGYIPISVVIYFLRVHVLRVGSKVMIVYCSEFSAEMWQLCGCSSLFPGLPLHSDGKYGSRGA